MIGLLLFADVFVAIKWKKTGKKRMKRLLGPTPWPITGNLLQLEEDPHIILTKSREKYGDMFQTKLGSMPVVVLHGIDTFKQALEIQGESFVGR
ncbi:Cytochrome P450 1A2, partial [Fulmarus glacialis]